MRLSMCLSSMLFIVIITKHVIKNNLVRLIAQEFQEVSTICAHSRIDAFRNSKGGASFYKRLWPIVVVVIIFIISVEEPYLGWNFMLHTDALFSPLSNLLFNRTVLCYSLSLSFFFLLLFFSCSLHEN